MSASTSDRLRWLLALTGVAGATVGALMAATGAIDRWAAPTAVGASLLTVGGALAAAGALVVLATNPARAHARITTRPGSSPWARMALLAIGIWPFATFGTFIAWRIGVSAELRAECDAGAADSCRSLAVRKERRGHADEAAALFRRGCELGEPFCCTSLAFSASEAAPEQVAAWLATGCDGGITPACVRLARNADPADASRLLGRACDLGDLSACDEAALLRGPTP